MQPGPSSSACHSPLAHLHPARQAVRRAQLKRPAQGAALIGLAPVSLAFFCASSGICIMPEVGVETTLPSSALTEVLQSSNKLGYVFAGGKGAL